MTRHCAGYHGRGPGRHYHRLSFLDTPHTSLDDHVCRGLGEGLGSFRGWAQLSGELGLSGTPSGIRELRPPVGTSADIPSQTWHRVRHYWNFTPALAATQHHSRLLAPARQLVCRRDQRLLPRRVVTQSCPRVIVRDHSRVATLLRRDGANQVSSYPLGRRHRQTSVCAQ